MRKVGEMPSTRQESLLCLILETTGEIEVVLIGDEEIHFA